MLKKGRVNRFQISLYINIRSVGLRVVRIKHRSFTDGRKYSIVSTFLSKVQILKQDIFVGTFPMITYALLKSSGEYCLFQSTLPPSLVFSRSMGTGNPRLFTVTCCGIKKNVVVIHKQQDTDGITKTDYRRRAYATDYT